MANHHFGNYGDVWKHLLLAQIIEHEHPDYIMESHAGAASYEMTEAAEREHGVGHFLRALPETEALEESRFAGLLGEMPTRDAQLRIYPGSPLIGMLICAQRETRYLFCDLDGASLASIRRAAEQIGVPRERIDCAQADGVVTVSAALDALHELQRTGTFVFIDPFQLFERNAIGLTALDLFKMAAASGAVTMLWYAFGGKGPAQAKTKQAIVDVLTAGGLERGEVWWAELALADAALQRPGPWSDLLAGCGVVATGLGGVVQRACTELSELLAEAYQLSDVPGGELGKLKLRPLDL